MRILADLHHEDLYNSLRILFEERLGWNLYRPIGLEWYREGFWRVFDHPATAEQYLGLHQGTEFRLMQEQQPNGGHRWLNDGLAESAPGLYQIPGVTYADKPTKGVTLDAFRQLDFDLIVSSMPVHFESFERLRQQYKPSAKHVFQMGNMWAVPAGVQNLMNSTTVSHAHVPNAVRYHQEFDRRLFNPVGRLASKSVRSFLHYHELHGRADLHGLRAHMPDWSVQEFGAGNESGPIDPGMMPEFIKTAGVVMHVKHGGDGYGFNIHHALACGVPVVFRRCHVAGQTADPILVDGVTGIDLDQHGIGGASYVIRQSYEEDWTARCREHFDRVCDFDREFADIKAFLDRLL